VRSCSRDERIAGSDAIRDARLACRRTEAADVRRVVSCPARRRRLTPVENPGSRAFADCSLARRRDRHGYAVLSRLFSNSAWNDSLLRALVGCRFSTQAIERPQCSPRTGAVVPKQPDRRRFDRPAVQFERTTARPPAAAAGEFRQGRRRPAGPGDPQPGNIGGNDRHDAVPR
jgi:hypothetical protein